MSEPQILDRLMADGYVDRRNGRLVPAARWHAAVARVAATMLARGEELEDMRVPVAWAITEAYSTSSEEELVEMVALMTPLTGLHR